MDLHDWLTTASIIVFSGGALAVGLILRDLSRQLDPKRKPTGPT